MKTYSFSPSLPFRITLVASAVAIVGLAGCSKQERQETKTTMSDAAHTIGEKSKEAYHASKDALANAWDKVKGATFEKRDEFAANAKALSAEMDAKVSKVQAEYSDAQASASRLAMLRRRRGTARSRTRSRLGTSCRRAITRRARTEAYCAVWREGKSGTRVRANARPLAVALICPVLKGIERMRVSSMSSRNLLCPKPYPVNPRTRPAQQG
jgi:hypothetical protein